MNKQLPRPHSTDPSRVKARNLLARLKIKSIPIDVEKVARKLKINIRRAPHNGNQSGFIIHEADGAATIGINALDSEQRQRFSIAHEIGHFSLHEGEMYIDHSRVNFRNSESQLGIVPEEIEANRFASELLMPTDFILEHYSDRDALEVEEMVDELAGLFNVSRQAMQIRLANMGLLTA